MNLGKYVVISKGTERIWSSHATESEALKALDKAHDRHKPRLLVRALTVGTRIYEVYDSKNPDQDGRFYLSHLGAGFFMNNMNLGATPRLRYRQRQHTYQKDT